MRIKRNCPFYRPHKSIKIVDMFNQTIRKKLTRFAHCDAFEHETIEDIIKLVERNILELQSVKHNLETIND